MKKILFVLLISLFIFSSFVTASNIPDDVLVIAERFDVSSLDPAVAYELTSTDTMGIVYDTLFRIKEGEVIPHLAKSYEVSDDGMIWKIYMREGAKFASGNEIDAEAVKFSLVRSMKMGKGPSWMLNEVMKPEDIKVLDKYTLQIKLKFPASYFTSILYNTCAGIVDPEIIKAHEVDGDWGENWLTEQSGGAASGPYKLTMWKRGDSIVLERNENYWNDKPEFKKIIIKNIKESVTQKMLVENGDVDIAYNLTPDQLKQVEKNDDVDVIIGLELRDYYLGMNVSKEPLNNVKVREAIKHAINYDNIIEHIIKGIGYKLEGTIPKPLLGHQSSMGVYEYNPEKAKELLAEAGYPEGFNIEFTGISSNLFKQLLIAVQSDLKEVGIEAEIRQLNAAAFYDLFRNQKLELLLSGWGADYPDPHSFAHPFGHSKGSLTQRVSYENPELDSLIEKAAEITDSNEREKLYHKIDKMIAEKGPWAMLYQVKKIIVVRNELKGYEYIPSQRFDFTNTYK